MAGSAEKNRRRDTPDRPLIVDVLAGGDLEEGARLVFEYVAMTQTESGRPTPASVRDLPATLRGDCLHPAESFRVLLVAYVDQRAVGCVGLKPTPMATTLEASRLYVRPDHRRNGVGWSLMTAAHARARACGARSIVLSVMPTRLAAIEFYRRLGYVDSTAGEASPYPLVHLELVLSDCFL